MSKYVYINLSQLIGTIGAIALGAWYLKQQSANPEKPDLLNQVKCKVDSVLEKLKPQFGLFF